MATHKYIYWGEDDTKNADGEIQANVHLLVGYNQASISDFLSMADELRQTFPNASNDKICGGKVFKSSSVDGHTIITWRGHIPRGEYPGWRQVENCRRFEYSW